jgi:16S rRNA (cytosine967-C5)-methyltransferase
VTPAARLAAAIALLSAIDDAPERPADAVANDYFRARRFIGSSDRRVVAERIWQILRTRRRLEWWLAGTLPTPRLLVAASALLDGGSLAQVAASYFGDRFTAAPLSAEEGAALARLEGHTLDDPAMPQAVRLEVPDWLLPRLAARFGPALEAELSALLEPAPLDLRVNTLKATRDEAQKALAAEGVAARPTAFSPWGLRVDGRRSVVTTRAFRSGLVEIQDEGSQLIAVLVGAAPGMRVADYCAGAGGKTLAIAMSMQNRGHLVACDTAPVRLAGAVPRLRRAGVHNVEQHLIASGDKWAKRRAGSFDRVLVDAPCTGSGTWRRNPAARLRLSPVELARLLSEQAAIIERAAGLVRNGGRLVYATCSLLTEENEAQVSAFLARHPEFAALPTERAWSAPTPVPCPGPYLDLTPRRHGTDGFFAAVLERRP